MRSPQQTSDLRVESRAKHGDLFRTPVLPLDTGSDTEGSTLPGNGVHRHIQGLGDRLPGARLEDGDFLRRPPMVLTPAFP